MKLIIDHMISLTISGLLQGYFKLSGICRSSDNHFVWREVFHPYMVLAIDVWLM